MKHNRQPNDIFSVKAIVNRYHRKYIEDLQGEHPALFREPEIRD